MNALAAWIAKRLWGHMLWLMRRPWMKRLQRRTMRVWPEPRRPRAIESLKRQNRLARRYGLPLLTLSINLLLGSCAITATYFASLALLDSGYLTPPDAIVHRGLKGTR